MIVPFSLQFKIGQSNGLKNEWSFFGPPDAHFLSYSYKLLISNIIPPRFLLHAANLLCKKQYCCIDVNIKYNKRPTQ